MDSKRAVRSEMSSSSSFSSFVVAVVASLVGCSAEADWSMSIASVADILESNCQGLGCLVSLLSSLHGQEVVTINQYHHYCIIISWRFFVSLESRRS